MQHADPTPSLLASQHGPLLPCWLALPAIALAGGATATTASSETTLSLSAGHDARFTEPGELHFGFACL